MNKLVQYKYETDTIETKVSSRDYLKLHDEEVEKYIDNGWRIRQTTIVYENDRPIKRTVLERYFPLPQRGLRAKCNPIDDACDIKDKIKELIYRYKYNVSTSTTALYEEFMEDFFVKMKINYYEINDVRQTLPDTDK